MSVFNLVLEFFVEIGFDFDCIENLFLLEEYGCDLVMKGIVFWVCEDGVDLE